MSIKPEDDPLLALYGSGKDLWADEHADEYVPASAKVGMKPPNLERLPLTSP
ncbi:MAG: hypothetical protein ACRD2U_05955 [Terriglobales bacterium]